MKNYQEVSEGVYQSLKTLPERRVDDQRVREIIEDKAPKEREQDRKSACSYEVMA